MRVTNSMLISRAMYDLDGLRKQYSKAVDSVNGRVLQRPSEDPQRVVEAMDLSGMKMRLERSQRAGQDARDWLRVSETSLTNIIDRLQAANEIAVQTGSPASLDQDGREALALNILSIRESLMREMNAKHREQYVFAGWRTDAPPFANGLDGGADYATNNDQKITRDVAPGLSVVVNVPGDTLLAKGDFIKTLSDMAADLRAGRTGDVITARLNEIGAAMNHLTTVRSDLGARQVQVEQYEQYAVDAGMLIDGRLSEITGADLETAVVNMTQVQTAYQAALSAFAKALPTSLVEYMLR